MVDPVMRSQVHFARPNVSPLGLRASLVVLASLIVATGLVVGALFGLSFFTTALVNHAFTAVTLTVVALSAFYLVIIHLALRRTGNTWRSLGFTRPTVRLAHLMWQIPLGLVLVTLAQVVVIAITGTDPAAEQSGIGTAFRNVGPITVVLLWLTIVVVTPIWEEAIFRGVIAGGIRRKHGVVLAGLVSSAAFAAAHAIPLLTPYFLVAGLYLFYLREFHRTLWAPVIFHFTINAIASSTVVFGALTS